MAYISFMECIYLNSLLKPQIFHRWPRLKGDFPGSSDQWLVEAKMGPTLHSTPCWEDLRCWLSFSHKFDLAQQWKQAESMGEHTFFRRSMLAAIWELLPLPSTCVSQKHVQTYFIQISFNLCPGKHLCSNQSTHQHPLPQTTTAGFFVRWSLVFFKQCLGESSGQDAKPKCFGASRLFL